MTTSTRTRTNTKKVRRSEADQLADTLTQAQTVITQARWVWGLWADTVRQEAEAAHGVGYKPDDPLILTDEEYRDALDLGTELDQALTGVSALVDHFRHIEQRAAEAAG